MDKHERDERIVMEQVKAYFKEEIDEECYFISKKDLVELWTVGSEITRGVEDFRKIAAWIQEKPVVSRNTKVTNHSSKGSFFS